MQRNAIWDSQTKSRNCFFVFYNALSILIYWIEICCAVQAAWVCKLLDDPGICKTVVTSSLLFAPVPILSNHRGNLSNSERKPDTESHQLRFNRCPMAAGYSAQHHALHQPWRDLQLYASYLVQYCMIVCLSYKPGGWTTPVSRRTSWPWQSTAGTSPSPWRCCLPPMVKFCTVLPRL